MSGYSLQGGVVAGGCSGWGQYYIVKQPIIECNSLHPVSTAPPLCRMQNFRPFLRGARISREPSVHKTRLFVYTYTCVYIYIYKYIYYLFIYIYLLIYLFVDVLLLLLLPVSASPRGEVPPLGVCRRLGFRSLYVFLLLGLRVQGLGLLLGFRVQVCLCILALRAQGLGSRSALRVQGLGLFVYSCSCGLPASFCCTCASCGSRLLSCNIIVYNHMYIYIYIHIHIYIYVYVYIALWHVMAIVMLTQRLVRRIQSV